MKTNLSLSVRKTPNSRPKRVPVEIACDLTNDQIRLLLEQELSRSELESIAGQLAISTTSSNMKAIRRDILKNLERQEGYSRLAAH
jgi:GTP-sensing pleiotropic transcriptional regulator CodY